MKSKGKIFMVDDDELILSTLSEVLGADGYNVFPVSDTKDIIRKIRSWSPDVVLLDITLPERNGMDILKEIRDTGIDTEVVMLTADDTAETAVKAMKLGAVDYLTKPFNTDEVEIVINNTMEKASLKQEVSYLRRAYTESYDREMVGASPAVKELELNMKKMADAHVSSILVTGENGTGKEVVARGIHKLMHGDEGLSHAPFIWINCAAMPESMLESELFGYDKGAFTDAKSDKKGLFEMAVGGTILLDEIGDMKTGLQSKLLRVLEERTLRRVGGKDDIIVDLTVIATTNIKLQEAVNKGEFRQDLFFRLSTFYLHVVPLRERQDDIPLLAKHFLLHFSGKYKKKKIKGFASESEKLLLSYSWPGNIRELRNLVERLVVLESAEIITPDHLPKWLTDESSVPLSSNMAQGSNFVLPDTGISIEEVEKDLIRQALQRSSYNRAEAARLLKMSYDTLRYQIKKYGLE